MYKIASRGFDSHQRIVKIDALLSESIQHAQRNTPYILIPLRGMFKHTIFTIIFKDVLQGFNQIRKKLKTPDLDVY